MKQYSVIPAEQISSPLRKKWRQLQQSNQMLANPFFCPEYTEAVNSVCGNVYIGLIKEHGRVTGILPYQQTKNKNIARPVGGRMSDYQGVISSPDYSYDVEQLLEACGIKIWDYDHLLLEQHPLLNNHQKLSFSPIMDLSSGFDGYVKTRREMGSKKIKQINGLWRKFERDIGSLRLEVVSDDSKAFQQVIEWKRQQCLTSGVTDFLSWGWTTEMLKEIWKKRNEHFSGILSVLYFKDEIIAAHLGMRSATVLHYWFPVYNNNYAKFSPGSLLLIRLAEVLAADGIALVDLGKGDDPYKASFATDKIMLAEGSIMLPSMTTTRRKVQKSLDLFLRTSPYAFPARVPVKVLKKIKTLTIPK